MPKAHRHGDSRVFNDTKYTAWYFSIIENARSQHREKNYDFYYENHHVIPKSLGGTNSKDNLVLLTFREHFIVHWLLTKMCVDKTHIQKMNYALFSLCWSNQLQERLPKNWQYIKSLESNRIAVSMTNQYGANNHAFGKKPWNYNLSKETDSRVAKYSESGKETKQGLNWYYNVHTLETTQAREPVNEDWIIGRPNIKGRPSPMKGKNHTKEANEKNRKAHLGVQKSKESIEKTRMANIGRKNTEETIFQMKKSATGNFLYTNIVTKQRKRFREDPKGNWLRGDHTNATSS